MGWILNGTPYITITDIHEEFLIALQTNKNVIYSTGKISSSEDLSIFDDEDDELPVDTNTSKKPKMFVWRKKNCNSVILYNKTCK